jgi:hypothetical protein
MYLAYYSTALVLSRIVNPCHRHDHQATNRKHLYRRCSRLSTYFATPDPVDDVLHLCSYIRAWNYVFSRSKLSLGYTNGVPALMRGASTRLRSSHVVLVAVPCEEQSP